jgi:Tfp pilus assembly protein PilX
MRQRGFTVAEMLTSSVLVALFFGLLYGLFLPVLGLSSAASAKVSSQDPASAAIYQLEADLRVSDKTSVTVGSSASPPPAGPLASADETTVLAAETSQRFVHVNDAHGQYFYNPTTGAPLYESYIVWALEPSGCGSSANPCTLYRTTVATQSSSGDLQPTAIPASLLSSTLSSITTNGEVMATGITSFQIAENAYTIQGCPAPCAGLNPEVVFELADASTDQNGKVSVTSYQSQVFIRN